MQNMRMLDRRMEDKRMQDRRIEDRRIDNRRFEDKSTGGQRLKSIPGSISAGHTIIGTGGTVL